MIGVSSLIGGFAESSGVLVGARLAQGLGAAMTLPAALSILTTSFKEGKDRHTALGVWGGVAGLASAVGVLLGGLLTEGPGWRWVMFVNPIAVVLVLGAILQGDPRRSTAARGLQNFDALGAVLATGGMLLLVYALVKAPDRRLGQGAHDRRARRRRSRCWRPSWSTSFATATRSRRCRSSASTGWGSRTSPS